MSFFGEDQTRAKALGVRITILDVLPLIRGCLGPVVMALITQDGRWALVAALVLMVFAEISGFLDGWAAGRLHRTSRIGEAIAAISDSIYRLAVFMAFVSEGWMPAWMLVMVYARELVVPYLGTFARQAGRDLKARVSASVTTGAHTFAQIGVVLVALGLLSGSVASAPTMSLLLLAAAAASLYSLLDTALATSRLLRE